MMSKEQGDKVQGARVKDQGINHSPFTIHHLPFLSFILFAYFLLALAYGLINPLFEAPDEHLHFFTAVWIAENNGLPSVPQPAVEGFFVPQKPSDWIGQEAAQPPLYYILASLVVRPFDTSMAREQTLHNPFVLLGDASAPANRNAFVHAYDNLLENPAGHVWAAHLLRVFSAVIGLGTLAFIYASARLLWPEHPRRALLAMGLVAFLPQFTFQHSAISNDVLVTFLATAVLYQLIRLERHPVPPHPFSFILLGLTIGLTGLTKNQGTALLVYALGFIVARALADTRPWLATFKRLLLVALSALALIGPLWWRNYALYGDITAVNQFVILAGGDRGYTILQVLAETPGLWLSLFANFGWFNILAPDWVYWFWSGLVVLAIVGAVWQLFNAMTQRSKEKKEKDAPQQNFIFSLPVLLAGWVVLVYASLLLFMMRTPAAQGRLLFPALLPIALGVAYGLSQFAIQLGWHKRNARQQTALLITHYSLLIFINLFCLTAVLRPIYAAPPLLASDNLPQIGYPLDITYPELGRLLGYNLSSQSLEPEAPLKVTLFWETEGRTAQPVTEFVQVVLEDGQRVAGVDTYHGRGNYSTAQWEPMQIFADEIWLTRPPKDEGETAGSCAPAALRLNIGLRDSDGNELATAQGNTTTTIGQVRLAPSAPEMCEVVGALDTAVDFGGRITLVGLETVQEDDDTLTLTLTWQALTAPNEDLIVFVHLVDANGNLINAYDSPPTSNVDGGVYPTQLWQTGDTVIDQRVIPLPSDLPAGTYQILVGLYRPGDFARLPIVNGFYANEALPVFEWRVPSE